MSHRLSVSYVARVTTSKEAHAIIAKMKNHYLDLARNPYLAGESWDAVWVECLSHEDTQRLVDLIFSASTDEQISRIHGEAVRRSSDYIFRDKRYPTMNAKAHRAVLEAVGLGEFESLAELAPIDSAGPSWYEPSEESEYILEEVTPKLDDLGAEGWTLFLEMLPNWQLATEDLLVNVKSLVTKPKEQ